MSIYSLDLNTPPDLIKWIEETVSTIPKEEATVHSPASKGKKVIAKNVRSCVTQACNMQDCWIVGFFDSYIRRFNQVYYHYDISHLRDTVQLITYDKDDHYNWHVDGTTHLQPQFKGDRDLVRKISFSFLCNDDYEGGDLEFTINHQHDNTYTVPKKKGRLIVFPSDTRHRVKPVTKGQRRSIVGWMVGPPWK